MVTIYLLSARVVHRPVALQGQWQKLERAVDIMVCHGIVDGPLLQDVKAVLHQENKLHPAIEAVGQILHHKLAGNSTVAYKKLSHDEIPPEAVYQACIDYVEALEAIQRC